MKKHLIKFLEIALGYNEEESLITKEGYEILADPIKRAKLRQWIELYKETGEWDYGFWDESKDEKLSQHDVSKRKFAVEWVRNVNYGIRSGTEYFDAETREEALKLFWNGKNKEAFEVNTIYVC